jgi:hypothetical protein
MRLRIILIVLTSIFTTSISAKRIKTKAPTPDKSIATEVEEEESFSAGSFMVASECDDCNNGYHLSQISFSGFDKPSSSERESFFVTNNTDSRMTAFSIYIEYLSTDGRQFHKRFLKLDCDIPPSETRKVDIKSWDRQHSFHYISSNAGRNKTTPFTVKFIPVAYWLQFNDSLE